MANVGGAEILLVSGRDFHLNSSVNAGFLKRSDSCETCPDQKPWHSVTSGK